MTLHFISSIITVNIIHMKSRSLLSGLFVCLLSVSALAQDASWPPPLEGRWDLTLQSDGKYFPGWLEVRHSGVSTLVGRVMLVDGSARPIAKINYDNAKIKYVKD